MERRRLVRQGLIVTAMGFSLCLFPTCAKRQASKETKAELAAKVKSDYAAMSKHLLPLLSKWRNSQPETVQQQSGYDTLLVIDPAQRLISLVNEGKVAEKYTLPEGYGWRMYRLTPDNVQEMSDPAQLKIRGAKRQKNLCKEIFCLQGILGGDEGIYISIEQSGIGIGSGVVKLSSFPFANYSRRKTDLVNESMLVPATQPATAPASRKAEAVYPTLEEAAIAAWHFDYDDPNLPSEYRAGGPEKDEFDRPATIQMLKSQAKWRHQADLNGDGTDEILLAIDYDVDKVGQKKPLGGMQNRLWAVLQKVSGGWRVVGAGFGSSCPPDVLKESTNGWKNIESGWHDSVSSGALCLYQFDGIRYKRTKETQYDYSETYEANGLQFRILALKTKLDADSSLPVEIEIRNVGKQAVYVVDPNRMGDGEASVLYQPFVVRDGRLQRLGSYPLIPMMKPQWYVLLEPGKSVSGQRNILVAVPNGKYMAYFSLPSGWHDKSSESISWAKEDIEHIAPKAWRSGQVDREIGPIEITQANGGNPENFQWLKGADVPPPLAPDQAEDLANRLATAVLPDARPEEQYWWTLRFRDPATGRWVFRHLGHPAAEDDIALEISFDERGGSQEARSNIKEIANRIAQARQKGMFPLPTTTQPATVPAYPQDDSLGKGNVKVPPEFVEGTANLDQAKAWMRALIVGSYLGKGDTIDVVEKELVPGGQKALFLSDPSTGGSGGNFCFVFARGQKGLCFLGEFTASNRAVPPDSSGRPRLVSYWHWNADEGTVSLVVLTDKGFVTVANASVTRENEHVFETLFGEKPVSVDTLKTVFGQAAVETFLPEGKESKSQSATAPAKRPIVRLSDENTALYCAQALLSFRASSPQEAAKRQTELVKLATGQAVLAETLKKLLDAPSLQAKSQSEIAGILSQLRKDIVVEAIPKTGFIQIAVTGSDARVIADVANAIAQATIDVDLYDTTTATTSSVKIAFAAAVPAERLRALPCMVNLADRNLPASWGRARRQGKVAPIHWEAGEGLEIIWQRKDFKPMDLKFGKGGQVQLWIMEPGYAPKQDKYANIEPCPAQTGPAKEIATWHGRRVFLCGGAPEWPTMKADILNALKATDVGTATRPIAAQSDGLPGSRTKIDELLSQAAQNKKLIIFLGEAENEAFQVVGVDMPSWKRMLRQSFKILSVLRQNGHFTEGQSVTLDYIVDQDKDVKGAHERAICKGERVIWVGDEGQNEAFLPGIKAFADTPENQKAIKNALVPLKESNRQAATAPAR